MLSNRPAINVTPRRPQRIPLFFLSLTSILLLAFISFASSESLTVFSSIREWEDSILDHQRAVKLLQLRQNQHQHVFSSSPPSPFPSLVDDDCPTCHNGGFCNETTHQCVCDPLLWGANDCSEKTCGLGSGPNPETNDCDCTGSGFDFMDCSGCESDDACNRLHNYNVTSNSTHSWHCSKDLLPISSKRFYCGVTDELATPIIGYNTSFQCNNIYHIKSQPEGPSACYFQSWANDLPQKPPGFSQEILDCSFDNCTYYYTDPPKNQLIYECSRSACRCMVEDWKWPDAPMYCDDPGVKALIHGMTGWAKVVCEREMGPDGKPTFFANKCTLYQRELADIYFELVDCSGRECYFGPYTPPDPTPLAADLWWLGLLIAGVTLGVIFLFIAVSCVSSIIHTQRVSFEYRRLSGRTFGAKLEIRGLSYFLKTGPFYRRKTEQILHGISHTIYPGQVVAILGPSGAGKTTMLDILANRNKRGRVAGQTFLNDKPYNKSFTRIAGYVSQEDSLMGTLTVRESLMFAANLKLPSCISRSEKKKIVNETMQKLKISHIANRKIGDALTRGISGGERRRVAIGMELVGQPHILFLDEPTSGLDASSAYTVIHELVNIAKTEGRTIVFSIHQPRTNIFQEFDELMLMSKGRLVYVGPADQAECHFNDMGYTFPQKSNIADSLIDLLVQAEGEGIDLRFQPGQSEQLPDGSIQHSPRGPSVSEGKKVTEAAPLLQNRADGQKDYRRDNYYRDQMIPYATSFYSQLYTLSKRALINLKRNFFLLPAHFISAIVIGLLLGAIYWKQSNNLQAIQNRLGSLFFMCSLLSFTAMSSLELFIAERAIYVAERSNGYYTSMAYFFSKTLFDIIPLRIFPAIIMGSICYYMIDLRNGIEHFAYFLLVLVLFNIASGAQCIAIAAIAPTVAAANVTTIVLILSSSLFGGFLLNKPAMPSWIGWMHWLSLYNYALEALALNELYDWPIIVDPKATSIIIRAKGQFILEQLGMSMGRFAVDVAALGAFGLFFLVLSLLLLVFFVREQR